MPLIPASQVASKQYAFVVVGAGTAGAVLASRLSENPEVNVLLIESGKHENSPELVVPLLGSTASLNKSFNWSFVTEPNPGLHSNGASGRTVPYPRGKLVGGTSAINFGFTTRGSSEEWDRLAEVTGDSRWGWENMLSLATKVEHWVPPTDKRDTSGEYDPSSGIHGTDGPILLSLPNTVRDYSRRVIEASKHLPSDPFVQDINAGNPLGLGWLPTTFGGGIRSTSARYLDSTSERTNLDVATGLHVTKLIYANEKDGDAPIVIGVECAESREHPRIKIYASKEVILSAGSICTPTVLQLSGIGDRSLLDSFSIPVVKHLPDVGRRLQDHPLLPNRWYTKTTDTLDEVSRDPLVGQDAQKQFGENFTGPLSNIFAQTIGSFRAPPSSLSSSSGSPEDPSAGPKTPHYEIVFADVFVGVIDQVPAEGNFFTAGSVVLTSTSEGEVRIRSSDPFDKPQVRTELLSSENDVNLMVEAVKKAREIVACPSFEGYIGEEYGALATARTDEQLREYVRNQTVSCWHPCGTASVSGKASEGGVLDPDFKVKGVRGLRVIDASVFPTIPAAHLQMPVYMIAELGASMIAEEHSQSNKAWGWDTLWGCVIA